MAINWTDAQKAKAYLYQVVDKETLVGTKDFIASSLVATVTDDNADDRSKWHDRQLTGMTRA